MVKPMHTKPSIQWLLVAFMAFLSASLSAQDASVPISSLEQTMYNSGKIWVVVAVAAVILVGIFAYLVRIDRAVNHLEKEMHQRLKQS